MTASILKIGVRGAERKRFAKFFPDRGWFVTHQNLRGESGRWFRVVLALVQQWRESRRTGEIHRLSELSHLVVIDHSRRSTVLKTSAVWEHWADVQIGGGVRVATLSKRC